MKKLLLSFTILLLSFILFTGVTVRETHAQAPGVCIPSNCNGAGDYEPDFNCINQKILNPGFPCCENKCKGTSTTASPTELDPLFTFFGFSLAITEGQQIPVLINLAITTFLGFVSVYAFVYGVYLGGYVRANTTDEAKIQEISKTLITLILGFILAWGFIVIIQVVANILGLGSLQNLELVGNSQSTEIVIK